MRPAGLRSIAVGFPDTVRTNDQIRAARPELVAATADRTLARVLTAREHGPLSAFDRAFARYRDDPFRGTVERRALAPGQAMLPIEVQAARDALAAAALAPAAVDTVLACSFLPDQIGIGSAVFIARALDIRAPAWNLETACSSATAALLLATALVRTGQADHVLVVVSCSYSRVADPDDTFGWFLGDGCVAFVVGPVVDGAGAGLIASHTVNTAAICDSFWYALALDDAGRPCVRVAAGPRAGAALRDTAEHYLRDCIDGAVAAAGLTLDDVDFFAFNTPTAWYADFCVRALGVARDRTIDTYPLYANIGPVLWPVNLHHAACLGRLRPGDLVVVYSIGSVSSAGAVVLRWGEVGLGRLPAGVEGRADQLAAALWGGAPPPAR